MLYAGAVWALAQGLAQLLPLFGDYEWIARWFVIAGIVGFPFWVAFSWFYEFTPQGLKRESEIAPNDSIAHSTGRKLDKWIIAVLVVAVVLLLTNTFVWRRGAGLQSQAGDVASAFAKIPAKSIAVLPFDDLSPAHDHGYFSAGMAEELLNALAKVQDLKEAWGYEYEVGYFKGGLASAKRAADALSGKIPLSYEALLVAGYRPPNIASTSAVGPPTTTLTGEIGLIRDPTLRDLAMRLLTAPMFDSIHEEGIDNPNRKAFRMAIPYEVQDALRSAYGDRLVSTGDYKAIGQSLDHPCVRRIFTRAP